MVIFLFLYDGLSSLTYLTDWLTDCLCFHVISILYNYCLTCDWLPILCYALWANQGWWPCSHQSVYFGPDAKQLAQYEHFEHVTAHAGKVANILRKLQIQAWNNKHLIIHTKEKIYERCVLSSLLYESETWASHTLCWTQTECAPYEKVKVLLLYSTTWPDSFSSTLQPYPWQGTHPNLVWTIILRWSEQAGSLHPMQG